MKMTLAFETKTNGDDYVEHSDDEIQPHCQICFNMNSNLFVTKNALKPVCSGKCVAKLIEKHKSEVMRHKSEVDGWVRDDEKDYESAACGKCYDGWGDKEEEEGGLSKCPCCENTYTDAQIEREEVVPCNKCYKCFVGDCGNTNCDCDDDDEEEESEDESAACGKCCENCAEEEEEEDCRTKPCSCGCGYLGGSCDEGIAIDNNECTNCRDSTCDEAYKFSRGAEVMVLCDGCGGSWYNGIWERDGWKRV